MTNREFQERVRRNQQKLYGMAYMLMHSQADCEDAVQEALIKAWRKLPSLRDEKYFESWLMRIVINECRNIHRKRARRGEMPLETYAAALPVSPEPELYLALKSLPEKYSLALTLKYISGYTVEEMAKILLLPKGTVASRLNKAKMLLRKELGEEERL